MNWSSCREETETQEREKLRHAEERKYEKAMKESNEQFNTKV